MKIPLDHARFWAITPWLAMALMTPLGGYLSDLSVSRFGVKWGRRVPVFVGTGAASLLLSIGSRTTRGELAIVLIAITAGLTAGSLMSWYAAAVDITRRFAGSLTGIMSASGQLGGVVSPTLTPYLASQFGWIVALDVASGAILLSGLLWFLINPEQQLDRD